MATRSVIVESNTAIVEYKYEWKINNFLNYCDGLLGSEFSPLAAIPLRLAVEFEPRVPRKDGNYDYAFNLIKLSKEQIPKTCRVDYVINVLNCAGSYVTANQVKNPPCTLYNNNSISLFTAFLHKNKYVYINEGYVCEVKTDSVTIQCQFKFYGHNVTTISHADHDLRISNERYVSICSDLKNMLDTKMMSDIIFQVGNEIFRAHSCILAARSPVFKSMLENEFSESKSNSIQITDYDSRIFECFLRYLYCGEIDGRNFDTVWDLYALADKYAVISLQMDCAEILASILTVDTVCRVVVLAYLHSNESLRTRAMQFINQNFSKVKESPDWKNVMKDYPELISELFGFMSANFG